MTIEGIQHLGHPGPVAIGLFLLFIGLTMSVTYWAAKRSNSTEDFYTAGGSISGLQNGFALAGDYMSAASFLGICGLVALSGFDGIIYLVGWMAGWPLLLFFVAEPLRNLGKYTLADAVSFRLKERPVRIAVAFSSMFIVILYMIAQMVGGGKLIEMMFGVPYDWAVILVGSAMICYVLFGGMLATTWVQIIKAVMLVLGGALLAGLALAKFNFNPLNLFAEGARIYGDQVLAPGPLTKNPWDVVSLSLALFLGTAALPHILMRFYTVPDAKQARTSVLYASVVVGAFYIFTFIIGFSAMVLLGKEAIMAVDKTGNVSALLLANLLGGVGFLGFIAAVAFATILAVVAGLTLSGAATLSHDFWVSIVKKGKASNREQMNVARIATLLLGATSIFLGIVFKKQNVAFMVGLAFAVAASSNFPALILTTFWRRCTTPGVVASMVVGTLSSLVFIYFSPAVQIDILGKAEALFPLKTPGLFSIPLSFLTAVLVSLCTKDQRAHDRFALVTQKIHLGDFVTKHREIAHGEIPPLPEVEATSLLMVAEETGHIKPKKGKLSSQKA